MPRVTQAPLAKALGRLKELPGPAGEKLALDHNSAFGGWKIIEVTPNSETDIFGTKRRTADSWTPYGGIIHLKKIDGSSCGHRTEVTR